MEQEQELIAINQPGEILTAISPFVEGIPPKKFKHFKNLAFTLSIITAIYLYESGLTKCPYQTEIQCSKNYLLPRLPILIGKDLISIIIYGIIVLLYKLKKAAGVFVCVIPIILP